MSLRAVLPRSNLLLRGGCFGPRKHAEQERPRNDILADYIYLQAYCHTRNAERTFRLDRIIEVAVEVGKE